MKRAALSFSSTNIGDDMQSLAAELHLDRVDRFIDRDALGQVTLDEAHACIMAAWFTRGPLDQLPPDALHPLFFGFCAGLPNQMEGPWLKYLRAHSARAPLGVRDLATVEWLHGHGVAAEWSGCLTLFAGRRIAGYRDGPRKGVLLVDIDEETEAAWLSPELRETAERVTNHISRGRADDVALRRASLLTLVDRMASAEAVITQRLHIALPCIGLGTPVYALPDPRIGFAESRFSGFDSFVPLSYVDEVPRQITRADCRVPRLPPELEQRYQTFLAALEQLGILGDPAQTAQRFATELAQINTTLSPLPAPPPSTAPGEVLTPDNSPQRIVWWSDRRVELAEAPGGDLRVISAYDGLVAHIEAWLDGQEDWQPGRLGPLEPGQLAAALAPHAAGWAARDLRRTGDLAWRLLVHRRTQAAAVLAEALNDVAPEARRTRQIRAELALTENDPRTALDVLGPPSEDALLSTLRARALLECGRRKLAREALLPDIADLPVALRRSQLMLRFQLGTTQQTETEALGRAELRRQPGDETFRDGFGTWLSSARGSGHQILARLRQTSALRRRPAPVPVWDGQPPVTPGATLLVLTTPSHRGAVKALPALLRSVRDSGWSILLETTDPASDLPQDLLPHLRTCPPGALARGDAPWSGVQARSSAAQLLALRASGRMGK